MIETSLPAAPADGDTILLRLGSSPYEYLMLSYDADYEEWVSEAFPVPGNAAEVLVSTTGTVDVFGPTLKIPNYDLFFDAGLRLEARVTGTYGNNNASGTATVFLSLFTGVVDQDPFPHRATIPGATSPGGTDQPLYMDSGWQRFDSYDPESDSIGAFVMRLTRNGGVGSAVVVDRQVWIRWATVEDDHINVFVAGM